MSTTAADVPEASVDPSTKDLILWVGKIIVWVARPVGTAISFLVTNLSRAVLGLIKLIYEPLSFLLAPFAYFVQLIIACAQAPFKFLAKFETLYIYLGIGALIGITGGLLLSFIYGLLQAPLGIDSSSDAKQGGRTAKQYREQRRKEEAKPENFVLTPSPESLSSGYYSMSDRIRKAGKKRGVLNQTIVEETDSD